MATFGVCTHCVLGNHDKCSICNCLADHPGDDQFMLTFKRMKRQIHPEREQMIQGGWNQPIRVTAEVGNKIEEK